MSMCIYEFMYVYICMYIYVYVYSIYMYIHIPCTNLYTSSLLGYGEQEI
jgi:hypothetical protein